MLIDIYRFFKYFFKGNNYIFKDNSRIMFSGRGGIEYNKNGHSIYIPWHDKKKSDYDLILDLKEIKWYEIDDKILEVSDDEKLDLINKIQFYCNKFWYKVLIINK